MSTPGCRAACLNTAGMGVFSNVQASRVGKTKRFFEDREAFLVQLVSDVESVVKKARRDKLIPAIRLNGTSDIRWETIPVKRVLERTEEEYKNIFLAFPTVQFYDYTKITNRKDFPANYHLTFSLSESNEKDAIKQIQKGVNVAAIFKKVPEQWNGYGILSGDEDDLRFLDPPNHVISLIPKGKAKKDTTGFVL